MSKRFTDTDLWKNQRWFRKLNPIFKLGFCYIKDQCNHAGIWKIDCSDLIEDLCIEEFDISKFVDAVNVEFDKISGKKINKERVRVLEKNLLWITGFIQFQYHGKDGKVNPDGAPARTALTLLEGLGTLSEGLDKGYIILTHPLLEGWQTHKEKDKVKDKGINQLNSEKNDKKFINPKTQGQELYYERSKEFANKEDKV